MREQFPWFLDPTEEELQRLWEKATFCFDANVLLNLYRVDRETTEDYFKIFRELGDRIFLPHEAANQFFQNRRGVIRTEQNSFSEAKERVENWVERRIGFDNLKSQLSGGNIGQIIEDEIEGVFEDRENYEDEVEAVKEDLIARIEDLEERFTPTGTTSANAEEDEILGGLMDIFEGKTGSELEEDLEELKDEAQERYEAEKPPGYEDYDGDDEVSRGECEDYFIWKQLMVYAGREGEDVIFITDDGIADNRKFDWWEKDDEYEIVRPRHELLREFRRKTEQSFWMLTTEEMVEGAGERLELNVKDKSVEQTEKTSRKLDYDDFYDKFYRDKASRSFKLQDISEYMKKEAKSLLNIRHHIHAEDSEESLQKIYQSENRIVDRLSVALKISDELSSDTMEKITEHFSKLSASAGSGNDELAVSYAADLEDYLTKVAETLQDESHKLAEASFLDSSS